MNYSRKLAMVELGLPRVILKMINGETHLDTYKDEQIHVQGVC